MRERLVFFSVGDAIMSPDPLGADVTVSKDVPGFVSNALLMPFINEVSLTNTSERDSDKSCRLLCA